MMPAQPKTICMRCGRIGRGSCKCQAKARDAQRGNSAQRGYGRKWRLFRLWFLKMHNYVCADCQGYATEVHHKLKVRDRPDLLLHESNCMPLCGDCHKARTARGE